MKFKKILKRKVYPTWVSTSRNIKGYKIYIFYISDLGCYHYQIEHDNDIIYISLTNNIKFNSFDKCCLDAETWIKNN